MGRKRIVTSKDKEKLSQARMLSGAILNALKFLKEKEDQSDFEAAKDPDSTLRKAMVLSLRSTYQNENVERIAEVIDKTIEKLDYDKEEEARTQRLQTIFQDVEKEYDLYSRVQNKMHLANACKILASELSISNGNVPFNQDAPLKTYHPFIGVSLCVQLMKPAENSSIHVLDSGRWLASIENIGEEKQKPWRARLTVGGGNEATDRYYLSKLSALEKTLSELTMTYFFRGIEVDFIDLPSDKKEPKDEKEKKNTTPAKKEEKPKEDKK